MRFGRLLAVALAIVFGFGFASTEAAEADTSRFVLVDGFVQVEGQKPIHLNDGPASEKRVSLGEQVRFWFDINLAKDAVSPCTSRDEDPCHLEFRLAPPDKKRDEITDWDDHEVRFSGGPGPIQFSMGYPINRKATLGHRVFYLRVRYGERVEYLAEVPVGVEE